jgi:hypothetical protein
MSTRDPKAAREADRAAREHRLATGQLMGTARREGRLQQFPALQLQVLDGAQVWSMGPVSYGLGGRVREDASRLLGQLAGATVEVSGAVQAFSPGNAALMPVAFMPLATKSAANMHLTFANGTASSAALSGGSVILAAEREARQFNALAQAAQEQS